MKHGFNTLLSQICIKTKAKVGVIEGKSLFVLFHHQIEASGIQKDLEQRFQSYGFSSSFARLQCVPLTISEEIIRREKGHLIEFCQAAFFKTESSLGESSKAPSPTKDSV
jgi:hypothetical protein